MRAAINKWGIKFLAGAFPANKPTLITGNGAMLKLAKLMVSCGVRRPLIIADGFMTQNDNLSALTQLLKDAKCQFTIFDEVVPNPTMLEVENSVTMAQSIQADGIFVVGGGSAIDIAKVVAATLTNGNKPKKLIGMMRVRNKPLPLFAVPTTSGTGSEVTVAAVISDPVSHQKAFFLDPYFVPLAAGLDTDLLASLPPAITAYTGMDALTHAIEAYIARVHFNDAQSDALTAIRLLLEYLPRAYKNGTDVEAREMVALASFMAGYAFSKQGLGYVHAISHQLSAHYNTPHGLANAVVLPRVLRFNKPHCLIQLAEIESAISGGGSDLPEQQLAHSFIKRIDQLSDELQINKSLDSLLEKDFFKIAKQALREANDSYSVPKVMKLNQVIRILDAVKTGEREVAF
ncbi:alcohol dehydrogenase [Pseudoalteromonas phenolica]|uniref:Alcohol dehydrogenase n=1 Tax=Pseudoalteromonas phenolica TaxID=161398 RepID=A0A4Q7IH01_9GAMM|nr:iron-containing alcohol dehydrogenase [Pseudoalteromonas phenolica]RZQ51324.1 alcohol dehydrogenase [Pseudoalteromonas phenolica]